MDDLLIIEQVKEIRKAVKNAKELTLQAPMPVIEDGLKLLYAHAIILQQVTMSLLMESRVVSGQKQVVRLELAAKLGREATQAFAMVMKHLPKEKTLESVCCDENVKLE